MITESVQLQRKLLLHLKCLFWCLNQMQTRYDLNLVLYSLEHGSIHPEIIDSNLGDNLGFLLDHLEREDIARLGAAMVHLPESAGQLEINDMNFAMGHYIQTLRPFGPIAGDTYGIISSITPQLRGLFLVDGEHLYESSFSSEDVRVIFGTYVV